MYPFVYLEKVFRLLNVRGRISFVISGILTVLSALIIFAGTELPEILIFLMAILIWIVLFFVSLKVVTDIHNRICRYEIDAEVFYINTEEEHMFPAYSVYFEYITVEYEFKGRKYRRDIRLDKFKDVRSGQKLKIKICEKCPGIFKYENNRNK